jgi:hypothetical protein
MSQNLAVVLDVADIEEREQVAAALQGVDTVNDLPSPVRQLLAALEERARVESLHRQLGDAGG